MAPNGGSFFHADTPRRAPSPSSDRRPCAVCSPSSGVAHAHGFIGGRGRVLSRGSRIAPPTMLSTSLDNSVPLVSGAKQRPSAGRQRQLASLLCCTQTRAGLLSLDAALPWVRTGLQTVATLAATGLSDSAVQPLEAACFPGTASRAMWTCAPLIIGSHEIARWCRLCVIIRSRLDLSRQPT